MTTTRAPRGMKHMSRGRLEGDEFDTMCDNPYCTDPGCEGSCMVIGVDGTVLQNLKGPRDPNTCPSCWENPCGCHLLYPEDIGMPCRHCYGFPCRCEPAADADGREYLEDALWAGELALMSPEERAEALRQDRIRMWGYDPDAV